MIQDISPFAFHITYEERCPGPGDTVFVFYKHKVMCRDEEMLAFPTWQEICRRMQPEDGTKPVYLFSVDQTLFFYMEAGEDFACPAGWQMLERQQLRHKKPKQLAFAAANACMLDGWYTANRFCGRCGNDLIHDKKERMLFCPHCQNRIYPRINPAVIVAVTNKSKLLLTKYNGRAYKNYALIAGFNEVGESLEDTVRREVMEEAGLNVKNIRYYASQPWAFADNLLAGFFCEVDGDDEIRMDTEELSVACWMERDEIPVEWDDVSLTNEMICAFMRNESLV